MLQLKQRVYRQIKAYSPRNPRCDLFAIGEVVEATQRAGYPPYSYKVKWLNQLGVDTYGSYTMLSQDNGKLHYSGNSCTVFHTTSDEAARHFLGVSKDQIRKALDDKKRSLKNLDEWWSKREKQLLGYIESYEKTLDSEEESYNRRAEELEAEIADLEEKLRY